MRFSRKPAAPPTTAPATTRGGAPVTVDRHTHHGHSGYAWTCHGCHDRGADSGTWYTHRLPGTHHAVTQAAKIHARHCHRKAPS